MNSRIFFALSSALTVFFICITLISCSSNGPVAPGINQSAIPSDSVNGLSRDREEPQADDTVKGDTRAEMIKPIDDFSTLAIFDILSALFFLKESGGGVLSIPLEPDEVVIHVFDSRNGMNLDSSIYVLPDGGEATEFNIPGYAILENVTFPLTVTADVPGYNLETISETSANVISFSLDSITPPDTATVFGVADLQGMQEMIIYSDDLIPAISIEQSAPLNPEFANYEFTVRTGKLVGYSAFLKGAVELGTPVAKSPIPKQKQFWYSHDFEWYFGPLKKGDKRFKALYFDATPHDGIVSGLASISSDYDINEILNQKLITIYPAGVFVDDERYCAMGPHLPLTVDQDEKLNYRSPYFNPDGLPDRLIIAGLFTPPDTGGIDIVHQSWMLENNGPELNFSGTPELTVENGSGLTGFPTFTWNNSLGINGDLASIEIFGFSRSWKITLPGDSENIDSGDLGVPQNILQTLTSGTALHYRVELLDASDTSIDEFNAKMIIRNRHETAYSEWVTPFGTE